jgi:membrane-associated phospholipid phosphatase
MVADVLATGNHYVLDVAGSGVLIIGSIAVAIGRARLVDRRFRAPREARSTTDMSSPRP